VAYFGQYLWRRFRTHAGTPLARLVTADPGTEMIEHDLLLLQKSERLSPQALPPLAADNPFQQSFVAERIETSSFAIALVGGEHQGEIARLTSFQKPVCQTRQQGIRFAPTYRRCRRLNGGYGLPNRSHLVAHQTARRLSG